MKFLAAGFHQESNSFSSQYSDLRMFGVQRGSELLTRHHARANTILAGFFAVLNEAGAESIPVVHYIAKSGGPVYREAVDVFLKELLDACEQNAPFDGICLDLHGATDMVGSEDCCGYILETIRRRVGENVLIAVGCDFHANITDRMWENASLIAGYQTYPHVDYFSTGARAVKLALMKLRGEQVVQARVRIPMIVPAEGYGTNDGPFADLTRECHQLVEQGEILDFSLYQMQPWLDLSDAGGTVLITAREEQVAARYAKELAHRIFELREQMEVKLYTVDEVIDAVKTNESKMPVILVDSADSPSAGSSADSSFVLARLLERGEDIRACLMVADPAAAAHAFELGVGAEGDFTLGGAYEPDFQKSITLRAYVKCLHDGNYQPSGGSLSLIQRTGKTAVLQIGSIDLVVYTRTDVGSDPQSYRAFGVEPSCYQLVMVKSATQYKVYYKHFSTLFYPTDTPGSSSANLAAMPFEHVPRPFWPLDRIRSFDDTVTFRR